MQRNAIIILWIFIQMRISETNKFYNDAMISYAVPPLETAGTVVLISSTGTIASLFVAIGCTSSDLLSTGLASSGCSSSGYSSSTESGSGSNLMVSEMVHKLGK